MLEESAQSTLGLKKKSPSGLIWWEQWEHHKTPRRKAEGFLALHYNMFPASKYDWFKHLQRQAQTVMHRIQDGWWERKAEDFQCNAKTKNSKIFFSTIKATYRAPKAYTAPLITADVMMLMKKKSINKRWREYFSNLLLRLSTVDTAVLDQMPNKPILSSLDLPQTVMRSRKPLVKLAVVKLLWCEKLLQVSSSQQDWWHLNPSTALSFMRKKKCPKTSGIQQLSYSSKIRTARQTVATNRAFPSCLLQGRCELMSSLTALSWAFQRITYSLLMTLLLWHIRHLTSRWLSTNLLWLLFTLGSPSS